MSAARGRGPFAPGAFPSRLRSQRLSSMLGIALAVTFGICFLTGLIDHLTQDQPEWFFWPSRPVQVFRVTQGLHVATGLATIPLLGAKLWSVYPRLFAWPPVRGLPHAAERLGILVLVAAALFQLTTGVLNIALWYTPMHFYFPSAHYWTAWLAIGAILAHIGVKLPIVRGALRRRRRPTKAAEPEPAAAEPGREPAAKPEPAAAEPGREPAAEPGALSRRGLLAATAGAATVITVATVGQTVAPLSPVSVLGPRIPHLGPQGVPINRSAAAARVLTSAVDPAWQLVVTGPTGELRLTRAQIEALPQATESLPITCVEGWSSRAVWTGVRLRDLVAMVGGNRDDEVGAESLEVFGIYRRTVVDPPHARDPKTLVAVRLFGEVLHIDHGYPARLIAPNRPGVLQTKWLFRLTVRPRR